jgi:Zn finger protein HypA/HybF involved in hydrogenase expression
VTGATTLTPEFLICYPADEYHFRREAMQAYCVKCRAKKEMKDAKAITMKNGKPATQGVCPTCGTKMFRIGKS